MNAADVDGFRWLGFIPVDGTCELHVVRISFCKGLAIEVGHDTGLIYVHFVRVFILDVAEVLKTYYNKDDFAN